MNKNDISKSINTSLAPFISLLRHFDKIDRVEAGDFIDPTLDSVLVI